MKLFSYPFLSSSSSSYSTTVLFSVSVLLIFSSSSSTTEAVVNLQKNVTVPAVLVFGDSIADQGNNNNIPNTMIKCNFPPYGEDFILGPTGRFSNGKTPPDMIVDWRTSFIYGTRVVDLNGSNFISAMDDMDQASAEMKSEPLIEQLTARMAQDGSRVGAIAEQLGIKELIPAYLDPHLQDEDLLTGVSFASGATGFDPQTPLLVSVIPLSDQLKMFKEYIGRLKAMVGEERTNFILTNSLYLVVAGSDDLANTYFTIGIRRLQYDVNSYTDLMVRGASDFVKELFELGAKRVSLFGAAPIGCLPSQRTLAGGIVRECNEFYNQAAQLFNAKASAAMSSLKSSLNDAKARLVYIDIYTPLLDLIQNHEKYGFVVADRGCCGTGTIEVTMLCNKDSGTCPDRSVYLFWDSYHPTERGYTILVNRVLGQYLNQLT